ncbi:CDP-alcohol phosphatidyltransferase family protein [uncultured Slackia sp.]|jgi:cardiolipin synthase|uniref:CDP-alcohol phosphatidyltransferase family protein n=1 Tax=uncultured Slackia sp. TaxID=665903 RepID=UPI00345BE9B3
MANVKEQVTNKIFTVSNVITFIRLCMIPAYFVLLLNGYDLLATLLFAVAASTDFLDGQIARRTHTVSRLGQILDPAVDRLLMVFGVVGLLAVGRLPLWVIVFVILRDAYLLGGGAYLLFRWKQRVPVIYLGKVATTFLFVGFAGLLLNFPQIPGAAVCDISWLPGFNAQPVSWGIWFVYAGLVLATITTVIYTFKGWRALKRGQALEAAHN